jgi:hypothetical protein
MQRSDAAKRCYAKRASRGRNWPLGREFILRKERDPQTGHYPAWVYTTGGHDALRECVESVGERDGTGSQDRSIGLGVRVVGQFELVTCTSWIGNEVAERRLPARCLNPGLVAELDADWIVCGSWPIG